MTKKQAVRGKSTIIDWALYPFDVMVSTEPTERVIKRIEKAGYKLDDEEKAALEMPGNGRTVILRGGGTVIQLRHEPKTPATIAILCHEVFHAVSLLFDRMGIKYSDSSDEAWAYAVQYLTEKALNFFKTSKRRR